MALAFRKTLGTELEKALKNEINYFTCQDKDVELFLKEKAFEFDKRHKSKTYAILDEESFINN